MGDQNLFTLLELRFSNLGHLENDTRVLISIKRCRSHFQNMKMHENEESKLFYKNNGKLADVSK